MPVVCSFCGQGTKWLSIAQAAMAFKVKPVTVRSWIRKGWLRAEKRFVAGFWQWRIAEEEVLKRLEAGLRGTGLEMQE